MTSIFKATVSSIGEINSITEIFNDENSPVPGLLISDAAVGLEMLADLGAFRQINWYNAQTEQFESRPDYNLSVNKTTITADGTDEVIVTGIPRPFVLTVGGTTTEIDSDSLEWSVTQPGTYTIEIESFPYLSKNIEVVAT